MLAVSLYAAPAPPPAEPRALAIYPYAASRGHTYTASIRGASLAGAYALQFETAGLHAEIAAASNAEQCEVKISVDATVAPGEHWLRVVTPRGVSGKIPLRVVEERVIDEERAIEPFAPLPAAINGRLTARGETDTFWIDAQAGQTMSFAVYSGYGPLDPSVTLLESAGSWFDASRLRRVAGNDEPLFFPGLSTDARLVHRFAAAGRYAVRVQAHTGQGGPEFSYVLRISNGAAPPALLHPLAKNDWDERLFTRVISADWLARLAARGAAAEEPVARPELYATVLAIPGVVEGRLSRAAETHTIRVKVDRPQDLALEIETPAATMPRFNPVWRLLSPEGSEIATNVYTKLNNNGLYMMKMIQAKTTVSLRSAGEYTLQIRDITTDVAGEDFAYRLLVRPRVPHLGKIAIAEDRLNLEPGASKAITVNVEREEGFAGFAAIFVEGLPAGVTAVTGMEKPVEKPPLPNSGKLERYIGVPQTATVLLVAAPDAPLTRMPATIRVIVKPMAAGRLGTAIATRELPLMVIARRPS